MFVIAVFMPLVIVITLGVTLALGLREHLFSPAAGAPRVAAPDRCARWTMWVRRAGS
ncbi:MAG: hypothetical protein R2692_06565 [Microbacterium sp.]